jgi:hypothetical protein
MTRLIATITVCVLLAGGCSLLADDTPVSAACAGALNRAEQVADGRTRALDRIAAVTEMDPAGTAAVIAHRDEVQRALFGPIARVVTRADARADAYRRLRGECRRDSGEIPPRCEAAFSQATRVARTSSAALQTRMGFWSAQVHIAQSAWAGDRGATERAIDRWDRLLTRYEGQQNRIDRARAQHRRATTDCRDAL